MNNTDPEKLQKHLYENIPISKAIGVSILSVTSSEVALTAPLKENINHKATVFGGSLHAVATLACWCLLTIRLQKKAELVITHSEIDYLKPIADDFVAISSAPDSRAWNKFVGTLERKGKARIIVSSYIGDPSAPSVRFIGTFAAISPEKDPN